MINQINLFDEIDQEQFVKFIQDDECYKCRYNVMPCWICSYPDTEDNYCICGDKREVID